MGYLETIKKIYGSRIEEKIKQDELDRIYLAMKSGLSELSSLCPDPLWEVMTPDQLERAKKIDSVDMKSIDDIDDYVKSWKSIFSEISSQSTK